MHELALCRNLVAMLEAEAQRQAFTRVRRVTLELGWLGHVDPEALAFGFGVVTRSTLAEGATLVIERRPARASCFDCGAVSEVEAPIVDCPRCGSAQVRVRGGDALRLTELEVV